jgi:hypothetical protein
VAETQPFQSLTIYDDISLFPNGMNSDLDPLLLSKDTLAFATNATVRRGFVTHRPPYSKKHLTIKYPSEAVQEAIEQGLFQGAAYYQPDSGYQSIFAAISGRLFQWVINGNEVEVIERTIPGDPNPATTTQNWLWQSENFLIVNDGQSLPIFFDGHSSRRSYGPSVVLATANAGPSTAPDIGDVISITLSAPYTGPYNVPVLFEGEYWQPVASPNGYEVSALQLFDQTTQSIPVGTPVYIKPSIAGVLASQINPSGNFSFPYPLTVTLTEPYTGPLFAAVRLFGKSWLVNGVTGNQLHLNTFESGTFSSLPAGYQIEFSASSAPNVLVGTVTQAAISPGNGNTVSLFLSNAFTGTPGQTVYIGAQGQYKITSVPAPPPGLSLDLKNLTAAANSALSYPADIVSVPELPPGRQGAYGLGQNWVVLVDGLQYLCSDIAGGPSGTQANNYRDAVLKTTEMTFFGGNFAIPGAGNVITSLTFTANLDLSLGQGSLQVGTPAFMASNIAPFDFQSPPTQGPILTFSLIGSGPTGQYSTIAINSDIRFRSYDGLGTLIQARRDFDSPGNTPIGEEMQRVLRKDNQELLSYGSKIFFDNRELQTCSPQASSQGVIHPGLIATNFDPVSGVRDKQPEVFDGLWTGINVLQNVTGIFSGKRRAFAFTFNVAESKIELYELLATGDGVYDNGDTPITWAFETAAIFNADIKPRNVLCSLRDGEIALDNIQGEVIVKVFYKPDQYPCWIPWHSFKVCAEKDSNIGYQPRLGLGEPSALDCIEATNTPARDAYSFQIKVEITGACRFIRGRFMAVTIPTPKFEPPQCNLDDPHCT